MSIEAMKQSMNTLTRFLSLFYQSAPLELVDKADECIDQLRQAIEQAEKQEPVAWVNLDNWKSGNFWPDDCFSETSDPPEMTPLYTALPQREWVGLTDDDIKPLCDEWRIMFGSWAHDFARAIEAKLKEKNT